MQLHALSTWRCHVCGQPDIPTVTVGFTVDSCAVGSDLASEQGEQFAGMRLYARPYEISGSRELGRSYTAGATSLLDEQDDQDRSADSQEHIKGEIQQCGDCLR
jgi:hypothetical protein